MRHVDDAHHAEGDGEPDRGEQQHRAERDAVPDVLRRVPQFERRPDPADGPIRGALQCSLGTRLVARQQRHRRAVAARRHDVDRRELVGLQLVGGKHRRRARFDHRPLDGRIGLLADRGVERPDRAGIGCRKHRPRRLQPHRRIRRAERERGERVADGPPQSVVDLDLGELAARRFAGRLARQRVEQARFARPLADDEHGLVGLAHTDIALRQRVEHPRRGGVAGCRQRGHDLLGVLEALRLREAGDDPAQRGLVGPRRQGDEQQQEHGKETRQHRSCRSLPSWGRCPAGRRGAT